MGMPRLREWFAVASEAEQEIAKLITALESIKEETDGRNASHIGQDRAYCIAKEVLREFDAKTNTP